MQRNQILLVLFVLLVAVAAKGQEKKVDYHYLRTGLQHKAKGDFKTAAIDLSIFLKYNPDHFNAHYYRGYCYLYQNEYEKALEDFKELTKLEPLNVDGPLSMARAYFKKGDNENTVKSYTKMIQLSPLNADAFNGRGVAYCRLNLFDLALNDFYKAVELDKDFAMAYCNAGAARYFNQDIENPTKKDLELAMGWFEKAIAKDSSLYLAYYNRAAINFFLENYAESLTDMRMVQLLKPKRAMNYFYSGLIYQKTGNFKRAKSEFNKAIQLNPNLPFPIEEFADTYKEEGNFPKAIAYYRKAMACDYPIGESYQGLMHYRIATIHALSGQKEKLYASLDAAYRLGVFNDRKVYQAFLAAEELKPFRSEKEMIKFTKKATKGKKESKFLDPAMRWFRMEQGTYN